MTTIQMHFAVVFSVFHLLLSALQAADSQLSIAKVGQCILEEEGYRFFTFTTDEPDHLLLTATLDDQTTEIMELPASKELVLAIKLGKENVIQAIKAHFARGSETHRFGTEYRELTFTTVYSSNPIEIGKPFLALRSPKHCLAFQVTKK